MRLSEIKESAVDEIAVDPTLGQIENNIRIMKIMPFDFPKGRMNKLNYLSQFIMDLRMELLTMNGLLSNYGRLCKHDYLPKVPGSGPVDAALEELTNLVVQAQKSIHRVQENTTRESVSAYKAIAAKTAEVKENVARLVSALEGELASNNALGNYRSLLDAIKDALIVLIEALDRMEQAITNEIIRNVGV